MFKLGQTSGGQLCTHMARRQHLIHGADGQGSVSVQHLAQQIENGYKRNPTRQKSLDGNFIGANSALTDALQIDPNYEDANILHSTMYEMRTTGNIRVAIDFPFIWRP